MKLVHSSHPYLLSFEDASVEAIRQICLPLIPSLTQSLFTHIKLDEDTSTQVLHQVPFAKELMIKPDRVSMFITPPRTYYRAHKDGHHFRFGLNYPLIIQDNKAVTRWYSDESIDSRYSVTPGTKGGINSREVVGFNPLVVKPVYSAIMGTDDLWLFNVGAYHDFHNRSDHYRVILTLRSESPTLTFEDAARLLI